MKIINKFFLCLIVTLISVNAQASVIIEDFELCEPCWRTIYTSIPINFSIDKENAYSGYSSFKISIPPSGAKGQNGFLGPEFEYDINEWEKKGVDTLSFWVKGDGKTNYNASLNIISYKNKLSFSASFSTEGNDWKQYKIKLIDLNPKGVWNLEKLRNSTSRFDMWINANNAGDFYLDRIELLNSKEDIKVDLDVYMKDSYRLFIKNTPVNFVCKLNNNTAEKKNLKLNYEISDYKDNIIKKESLSVNLEKQLEIPITIKLENNGVYWVKFYLDNDTSLVKEHCIGIIPENNKNEGKDSYFGVNANDHHNGQEYLKNSGISWIRIWSWRDCSWAVIEREKGVFDWSISDKHVDEALKNNRNILYDLTYIPTWANTAPENIKSIPYNYGWHADYKSWTYPPKDISDWENFIEKIATRYKGKVKYWEIWNEPNAIPDFYIAPNNYYNVLKSAYTVLKKVDPENKVVGINTPCGFEWMTEVFKLGGLKYMDIVSIHNYCGSPENDNLAGRIKEAKGLIKKYGGSQPLWDTESGVISINRTNNRIVIKDQSETNYMTGGYSKQLPEEISAARTIRHQIISKASGNERQFYWDDGIDLFGLFYHKSIPRLSAISYIVLVNKIDGAEFVKKIDLKDMENYGYIFKKKDKNILVVWTIKESDTVTLKFIGGNKIRINDIYGNPIGDKTEGNILTYTLTSIPIYVEGDFTDVEKTKDILELSTDSLFYSSGDTLKWKANLSPPPIHT